MTIIKNENLPASVHIDIIRDRNIGPDELAVYVYLIGHDQRDLSLIDIRHIAGRFSMAQKRVKSIIGKLARSNYIVVEGDIIHTRDCP